MRTVRCLGYARVSSAEQALGTSLEDQQNVIRAYAKGRGLDVTRMYVEAESAVHEKIERRDQIRMLLADVRAGDLVVCDKIDRWSRDPEFTYSSIRRILQAGASFYAVGDACDPSTPEGDTMLNFRVLFAREEHKRIKIRMVGTRKLLKDRGYYAEGLPPWGYRRQEVKGADRNSLVVDDEAAAFVRDIFRRCINGESISEIADMLGVKRDRVADALRNRVYLGEQRNASGAWMKGRHPAIVDPYTFVEAAKALDRRRLGERSARPKSETSSWWLRDIAKCGLCGAKMSSAYAGPSDARRYYFRCFAKCTPRYVRVSVAEAECDPMVVARLNELREELAGAPYVAEAPRARAVDIAGRIAKLEEKKSRYIEAFAAKAIRTTEDLNARLAKVDEERTRLEALTCAPPPVPSIQRRTALRAVEDMAKLWRVATTEEKRVLVQTLARSVSIAADAEPRFDWHSADDLARRG